MPYTTINKSTDYFNTKLYTGNGSAGNSITGVGFQSDWTWIKDRDNVRNHVLTDAVRGVTKNIFSNTTGTESTDTSTLTAFNSDGFTLGNGTKVNGNSINFASWNWKANGQGSSNTDGSINTTYTSVNTTAGFSICQYTGTGSNATIGHGLGAAPKMIIVKNLDQNDGWYVYHVSRGATKHITLDSTGTGGTNSTLWQDTEPTSSVFSIGTNNVVNTSGEKYIAYCFAEKVGYSKFGSYVGNANVDGPMIVTGMKPSFILIKNTSATASWRLVDNKRIGYNPNNIQLYPNLSNAESTSEYVVDILSNGFKVRATDSGVNGSGNTMIYIAIGQSLVGSNNVPCTAR